MIGYVTIGTNDLGRAVSFYDTVLSELGASQLYSTDRMAAWGTSKNGPGLMVNDHPSAGAALRCQFLNFRLAVLNAERRAELFAAFALPGQGYRRSGRSRL